MLRCEAPVIRPRSLAEALRVRSEQPHATVLAGGTDVMVYLEGGVLAPKLVLDLLGCAELRGIRGEGEGRFYGALTTCTDVLRDPGSHSILHEACATVGAVQIQNRATLGGNICNASPAGDTLPVWLALDAEFELASLAGRRRVRAEHFWKGYKRTELAPAELLVGVYVPRSPGSACFRKVGTRMAQSISKVVFAGRRTATEARLAFGAVGPVPMRLGEAERALTQGAGLEDVLRAVGSGVAPIDDVRSTATYRRKVAQNVVRRWLEASP